MSKNRPNNEYLGVNKARKNTRNMPLHQPNFASGGNVNSTKNSRQQTQLQFLYTSENDFMSTVQQYTGLHSSETLPGPPNNPPKSSSSRLQKNRLPPSAQTNRPKVNPPVALAPAPAPPSRHGPPMVPAQHPSQGPAMAQSQPPYHNNFTQSQPSYNNNVVWLPPHFSQPSPPLTLNDSFGVNPAPFPQSPCTQMLVNLSSTAGVGDSRSISKSIVECCLASPSPAHVQDSENLPDGEINLVSQGVIWNHFSQQVREQVDEQCQCREAVEEDFTRSNLPQVQPDLDRSQLPEPSTRPGLLPDSVKQRPPVPAMDGVQQVPADSSESRGAVPGPPWSKKMLGERMNCAKSFAAAAPTMKCDFVPPAEKSVFIESENIDNIEAVWGVLLLGRFDVVQVDESLIDAAKEAIAQPCKCKIDNSGWVVFKFESKHDMSKTLGRGPYCLSSGKMLYMKEFPRFFSFGLDEVAKIPVWLRLKHLPFELWNERAISAIASFAGRPIQIDDFTTRKKNIEYARVLVEVDLGTDLPSSVEVKTDFCSFVQGIEYENLPSFCRKCNMLGHVLANCDNRGPASGSD